MHANRKLPDPVGVRPLSGHSGSRTGVGRVPLDAGAVAPARSPLRGATPAPRIRVLLCDTSELYRAGLRVVLGQMSDVAVVAEAGSVTAAVEAVERIRPDVVLVDLQLPGGGALEVVQAAVRNGGRVLAMVPRIDADEAAEAIRSGVDGYLLREMSAAQLAAAVRLVFHGVAVLAGPVARELGARPGNTLTPAQSALATRVSGLTERQLEVFRLVADGLSNTEVARRLHVSDATVKSHVSALLRKLELRDRTQLVVFAHRGAEPDGGCPAC